MIDTKARLVPTRRLRKQEQAVFDRVLAEFPHLQVTDAEQLTQFAEATVRYEQAAKETRKRPTVETAIVNRSTGNQVGTRTVRNPAFATLKEANALMISLARRLLIDAASAEKRQRLLTKKARAAGEAVDDFIGDGNQGFTEEQIQAEMDLHRSVHHDEPILRRMALEFLSTRRYVDAATDEDIDALLSATVN